MRAKREQFWKLEQSDQLAQAFRYRGLNNKQANRVRDTLVQFKVVNTVSPLYDQALTFLQLVVEAPSWRDYRTQAPKSSAN